MAMEKDFFSQQASNLSPLKEVRISKLKVQIDLTIASLTQVRNRKGVENS